MGVLLETIGAEMNSQVSSRHTCTQNRHQPIDDLLAVNIYKADLGSAPDLERELDRGRRSLCPTAERFYLFGG